MIVAALLVVPVVALDETQHGGALGTLAAVLDWAIWSAFAAELMVLLIRTPDRGGWRWRHPLDASLVVLTPPFLPELCKCCALRAWCASFACYDCCA
jgi:hypothetical protein